MFHIIRSFVLNFFNPRPPRNIIYNLDPWHKDLSNQDITTPPVPVRVYCSVMNIPKYTTIIFDLGDVLFSWSSDTKTSISSSTLRQILSSATWFDYERGLHTEESCYQRIAAEFSIRPSQVKQAFADARDSLQSNDQLIALIHQLKAASHEPLRVFAMSNISAPDYEVLRTKSADWSVFDRVFTSFAAGERKPNLGFYRTVMNEANIDPLHTIFIDDKFENVLAARSLGIHGIVFDDFENVKRALRNLLGDPIQRGRHFLRQNARHLDSITDNGVMLKENFSQLLILEATGQRELVELVEHETIWNFFQGKGQLTTEVFPFDVDTTALGTTVFARDSNIASVVMREMLEHVNADGIVQTYFDRQRPRFDPVVCVNALTLFYTYDQGPALQRTLQWVYEVLLHRAYLEGTRYYATPECFLFFLSRLLDHCKDPILHALLMPLLKLRVQERVGASGDALALAMRIIVCDAVGIRDDIDLRALLPLQCDDGGWEIGWIYKYGSSKIKIGNRGLATALAIKAIISMSASATPSPPSSPTLTAFSAAYVKSPSESRQKRRTSFLGSLQWLWPKSQKTLVV